MTEEMDPLLRRWYNDDGQYDHRHTFNIDASSVVFDVGGYDGSWSRTIAEKYNSNIYLFEPVKEFYDKCCDGLKEYSKIKCLNYGISKTTGEQLIYLLNDGSNTFVPRGNYNGNTELIQLKSINDIWCELNIDKVDAIKINAEGAEYDLLEGLFESNKISCVHELLIQYHGFVDNAIERKKNIENTLNLSHDLVFDYDFIWQKWKLK